MTIASTVESTGASTGSTAATTAQTTATTEATTAATTTASTAASTAGTAETTGRVAATGAPRRRSDTALTTTPRTASTGSTENTGSTGSIANGGSTGNTASTRQSVGRSVRSGGQSEGSAARDGIAGRRREGRLMRRTHSEPSWACRRCGPECARVGRRDMRHYDGSWSPRQRDEPCRAKCVFCVSWQALRGAPELNACRSSWIISSLSLACFTTAMLVLV